MLGDYHIKRSYFWAPLLLMTASLVFSWIRGMWMLQDFRIVYEIHESIMLPISFFVIINMFRDKGEWRALLILLI